MAIKDITITSKNQVTLPADYVRKIGLAKHRILKAELKGNSIVLTAEPGLEQQMRKFWNKQEAALPSSDAELTQAARQAAVRRAN